MSLKVAILPAALIPEAVDVLASAFIHDPVFSFYFPDQSMRNAVFKIFFDDIARSHHRFGQVYGAFLDDVLIGTAVWRPPDAAAPNWSDRLRTTIAEFRLRRLSRAATDNVLEGFAGLGPLHPSEPHWYLFFVGIKLSLRGHGHGAQLLAPVLDIADRTQRLCYLETPFPETHPFYHGLAFEITREGHFFKGAPTVWTMTRSPKAL